MKIYDRKDKYSRPLFAYSTLNETGTASQHDAGRLEFCPKTNLRHQNRESFTLRSFKCCSANSKQAAITNLLFTDLQTCRDIIMKTQSCNVKCFFSDVLMESSEKFWFWFHFHKFWKLDKLVWIWWIYTLLNIFYFENEKTCIVSSSMQ